jgi:multiple sugar transport system ATP-binding protein
MDGGVIQQFGTPDEIYGHPKNLFVAGFIGSPAMNFMPATIEGDTVELPMASVRHSPKVLEKLGEAGDGLIAGIRPEAFEDARLVGEKRDKGVTFKAKLDVVESLGSELFVHFPIEHGGLDSQELQELAEDAGTAEVPGGGAAQVVARLDAASKVAPGQEAELWVDTRKVSFFKPDGTALITAKHLAD